MSKHSILILDDEEDIRVSLVDFFIDFGCQAQAYGTGNEALRALDAESFDLAIVDMRLPDMDGETFIHRAFLIQPTLRFVVHTGSLEFQNLSPSSFAEGPFVETVIHKPITDMQPFHDIINKL